MKKKKWAIIGLIIFIFLVGGIFLYNFINDDTKLSSEERTWINSNINNINNIYIKNDENIFSKDGHGVFFK